MNYYARRYNASYDIDTITPHLSIIEGVYEANLMQKAKVIGDVNLIENSICKYVKQPYDVVNMDEYTITLKKTGEATYTLLSHLLTTEGYTQERIIQLTTAIHNISNNTSIKTNQNCYGDWISFE